ncbi:MAG: 50S ribosomal protein L28 [Candidatus Aenigmarchaeota archaeon]|nr:50S ribosomal protein L28 [Candidatus Aenigmarchaeota archaeon]
MATICEICEKKKLSGHNVSHSHRKTKRKWLPNIQKAKILIDGKLISVNICSQCLKTQSKITKSKKSC